MKTKFALLLLGLWLGGGALTTALAQPLDYGDTPSPFPTLLANNGARHVSSGFQLGPLFDSETDGQPNVSATGDDLSGIDDEDGVFFPVPFFAGFTANVQVVVSSPAPVKLDAWMDFNGNSSWAEPSDVVATNRVVNPGTNIISVFVPPGPTPGPRFARFRLSSQGSLAPTGLAPDGEVEDYQFTTVPGTDYGDAPAPYPTLAASNGARHTNITGVFLGARADPELNGLPDPNALGDDNNPTGLDDEDGVSFLSPLMPGQNATVQIQASISGGLLNAWVDFNADGDWADVGEQIFTNNVLSFGFNVRTFAVPAGAGLGPTFARFRFGTTPGLSFTGGAASGEVEDYQVNITGPMDFGDAPTNGYPTLLSVNGARHGVTNNFLLGSILDTEPDGQPDFSALGDDFSGGPDDEDGVVFPGAIYPGLSANVQVACTMLPVDTGKLDAWMDFNNDGDWSDPGEKILAGVAVFNGVNNLAFNVPASAAPGTTFARFRLSHAGGLNFDGPAADGEVEDHEVNISSPLDFGDAPTNNYPTLLSQNGAHHTVVSNFCLGLIIDAEPDGQPTATATGDDVNPTVSDDEDGVSLPASLPIGQNVSAQVFLTGQAGQNAFLFAWVDFNHDGDWNDSGEQVVTGFSLAPGNNNVNFTVPVAALPGTTFARFRLGHFSGLGNSGFGQDGEVEDYQVTLAGPTDFSDAPTNNYPTTLAANGARHTIDNNIRLGSLIDSEPDGQPDFSATGDDINPTQADDEDGVLFTSALISGQIATVRVTTTLIGAANPTAKLNAWMDFNADGDWADAGEQIFTNVTVFNGPNDLTFTVSPTAVAGGTFARFRLSLNGGLSYDGPATEGEVEDYQVGVEAPELDFSDAPEAGTAYPTTLTRNGARHVFLQGLYLGVRVDPEPDGQPNANATGDDIVPPTLDDEDGVVFSSALSPGRPASIVVTASQPGFLNVWFDFNADGDWADPGEQVFAALFILAGPNSLVFNVPASAQVGGTFARFRYSRAQMLPYDGPAPDGEVEDYQVNIIPDRERCDLDCDGLDFWLTFPGNYAPDTNNPVRPTLAIAGAPGTVGTVSIAGLGFAANFTLPATLAAYVPLPAAVDLGDANDSITNKGIHVIASAGVKVTAFSQVHYTSDSYLALHTSTLGTEYIVLGFGNEHTNVPPLNGTQFAIVGTESNTVVNITPSVATLGHPANVAFSLVLHPGDCYQLRNTNDVPADLAGTLITADKPIGVFGSHQVANLPSSNVWFADYIVEQLLPVNTWGTDFYTAPLATRLGDTFRCLASQNGTTISLNGFVVGSFNRGQFAEFIVTNGAHLTATKPIFVAQYANSSDFDGVINADPFMLTVLATKHFVNSYIVCTPTNDFAANYVHIIAPTSAVASVLLDGGAVGAFTPISGTGYAYRRQSVSQGAHTVTANAPMGVSVYGWAEFESYGHPGCYFVGDVLPPTVNPSTTAATGSTADHPNTPGFVPVPDFESSAAPQDNCTPQLPPPTQTPRPGTLVPPGVYTVPLTLADNHGNVSTVNITFTVIDPSPVIINCPSNLVTDCTSSNGAIVNFVVTAQTTYETNVAVVSTPPSGSLFPPGLTTVNSTATSLAGISNACAFVVDVRCAGTLTIVADPGNNTVTVRWTGSPGTLEGAPAVTGPWNPVTNGVNSYIGPPANASRYFRVRH